MKVLQIMMITIIILALIFDKFIMKKSQAECALNMIALSVFFILILLSVDMWKREIVTITVDKNVNEKN